MQIKNITKDTRIPCNKIDNITINTIKEFLTNKANHNILSNSEIDELQKINHNNLTTEAKHNLTKHIINKIYYSKQQIKIEINRESIKDLKEYQDEEKDIINKNKNIYNSKQTESNSKKDNNLNTYISSDEKIINILIDTSYNNINKNIITIKPNITILKAVSTAFKYRNMIEKDNISLTDIARQYNIKEQSYITRIVNIAYLSPKIIESIAKGYHKENLTIKVLENISNQSIDWLEQERLFKEYEITVR